VVYLDKKPIHIPRENTACFLQRPTSFCEQVKDPQQCTNRKSCFTAAWGTTRHLLVIPNKDVTIADEGIYQFVHLWTTIN